MLLLRSFFSPCRHHHPHTAVPRRLLRPGGARWVGEGGWAGCSGWESDSALNGRLLVGIPSLNGLALPFPPTQAAPRPGSTPLTRSLHPPTRTRWACQPAASQSAHLNSCLVANTNKRLWEPHYHTLSHLLSKLAITISASISPPLCRLATRWAWDTPPQ